MLREPSGLGRNGLEGLLSLSRLPAALSVYLSNIIFYPEAATLDCVTFFPLGELVLLRQHAFQQQPWFHGRTWLAHLLGVGMVTWGYVIAVATVSAACSESGTEDATWPHRIGPVLHYV